MVIKIIGITVSFLGSKIIGIDFFFKEKNTKYAYHEILLIKKKKKKKLRVPEWPPLVEDATPIE
jgi:hypothetical protein